MTTKSKSRPMKKIGVSGSQKALKGYENDSQGY